ncbi:hypothetical protein GDO78_020282 [Eleutherodactylus coqui]|uniref:5-hydroxytryptamine receptor 3A n=1 Tax=Eleutherodactylus coqui TaxID=57060 RepID=A0A8J6EAE6_ELECQ|nr:hypothetical protein GDO78_020282 [Eleutherodactylus coqui]
MKGKNPETAIWDDEFLQWDPKEYDNIKLLSLPSDYVWIPDIQIEEFVHSEKHAKSDFIYVDYSGTIYHQKTTTMSTMCIFNMYYFPFDKQNCTLSFRSQRHVVQHINVSMFGQEKNTMKATQKYNNKGEFELLNIIFRRYPMFYIVNLIMPSAFLIIMDLLGFYLPPESGERISFKITVLLGYSVFLIIVTETLPALAHETALIASMKEHHEILQSILNEVVVIRQDLGKEQDQDTSKEWLIVGYVLDKFLFCVYLVILLIYAISLTLCWLNY